MRISDWSSDVCSSDLPRPQVAIITTPGRVAHRRPVHAEDRPRPTLADAEQLPSMLDSLPLSGGPHQFFAETYFSKALSSMAYASRRLSREYASSTTFSLISENGRVGQKWCIADETLW